MSSIEFKASINNLRRALRDVATESKKTEAEIVNKAAKDIAFRAASFTPKSSRAAINKSLPKDAIYKIAAARLNRLHGKKMWTSADRAEMAGKIRKSAFFSIGALRAGWIPAITALGGKYRGAKLGSRGSASRGDGKKATIGRLVASIRSTIITQNYLGVKSSAENISLLRAALNKAVDYVASDRDEYVRKKIMNKMLKEHSDKPA